MMENNTIPLYVQMRIKDEAQRIRSMLKDGNLYGYPLHTTDTDALIVAAYHAGMSHVTAQHINELEELREFGVEHAR